MWESEASLTYLKSCLKTTEARTSDKKKHQHKSMSENTHAHTHTHARAPFLPTQVQALTVSLSNSGYCFSEPVSSSEKWSGAL